MPVGGWPPARRKDCLEQALQVTRARQACAIRADIGHRKQVEGNRDSLDSRPGGILQPPVLEVRAEHDQAMLDGIIGGVAIRQPAMPLLGKRVIRRSEGFVEFEGARPRGARQIKYARERGTRVIMGPPRVAVIDLHNRPAASDMKLDLRGVEQQVLEKKAAQAWTKRLEQLLDSRIEMQIVDGVVRGYRPFLAHSLGANGLSG